METKVQTLKSLYNAQKAGKSIDWMSLDYSESNWVSMQELAQVYSLECPNIPQTGNTGYRMTDYQIVAGDNYYILQDDIKDTVKRAKYPHLYCSKCGDFIGSDEDEHVAHYGECH